jgi:hypothetical protein
MKHKKKYNNDYINQTKIFLQLKIKKKDKISNKS